MSQPEQLTWKKSSYSTISQCIEVAFDGDTVLIRESDDPDGLVRTTREKFERFKDGVRNYEFD